MEKASFGTSSEYGKKRGDALIIMTPISLDGSGKGQVDPRRWREYLSDGTLLRWHSLIETRPATFWSNAKAITHVQLIKEEYRGGRWRELGREKKDSLVTEAAATSTLGILSEAIHESWGVGHVLKAGEVTAKTLYTGLVSAGNMGLWGLTGKDAFHLEASGGYASNPAMRALLDDKGFLDRLSAGERAEVELKARENRTKSLAQAGFTKERTDPAVYAEILNAPYGSDELVGALQDYGAGSYGRRILEKAAVSTGASKVALTAAGSVVRVTENVAETLLNPVIWATFGVARSGRAQGPERGRHRSPLPSREPGPRRPCRGASRGHSAHRDPLRLLGRGRHPQRGPDRAGLPGRLRLFRKVAQGLRRGHRPLLPGHDGQGRLGRQSSPESHEGSRRASGQFRTAGPGRPQGHRGQAGQGRRPPPDRGPEGRRVLQNRGPEGRRVP